MNEKAPLNLYDWAAGRTGHPFRMWDGIQAGPSIVEQCVTGEVAEAAIRVAQALKDRNVRRVYLLGCGTSYFAGMSIAAALAEFGGIDADSYNAFEFGRYKVDSIGPNSAVIAISHSGHTKVDIEAIQGARRKGVMTVCLTDVPESPLAEAAEFVVPGAGGRDPSLPKTRSYLAALVKGYLIAVSLSGDQKALDELHALPVLLKSLMPMAQRMKDLAETYAQCRNIMVVGGGPNAQTAMEIALKFKEAALIPAEGLEIEEAIHGPATTLDEETLVIALSTPGASYEKIGSFCRAALVIGSPVINVTTVPYDIEGATTVEVKAPGIRENFTPPLLVYPMQMMVYWTSLARGIVPDVIRTNIPKYKQAMMIIMPAGTH
ncbi:MAG TPA: SIS domain-containing protein [Firmicutes bacterium]|nr:SIS domain-containing protein [Candidatus Fermentithermobacillaceae bacterium]